MKLRSKLLVILTITILLTYPQYEALALSSASGHVDIAPAEWWHYPMIIEVGEVL